MTAYDCRESVEKHRQAVFQLLQGIATLLVNRAHEHDASKLVEPEKSVYDVFVPKLDTVVYGSDEYKANLVAMGPGLEHHYAVNRHHPQHFLEGVTGMTLIDLLEMVVDWYVASKSAGRELDLRISGKRFKIGPQLMNIIANTMLMFRFDYDGEKFTGKIVDGRDISTAMLDEIAKRVADVE